MGMFDLSLDNLFSDDPKRQAMLTMAMGLLGGSGKTNKNFAADLGSAGLLGMQAYGGARQMQAKLAEEEQQKQLRQFQIQQAQQTMQDQQGYRGAMDAAPDVSKPMLPNMAPTNENAAALAQQPKPSAYDQAAKMVEYLRGKKVSEQYVKPYVDQMEKLRPKFKADQQLVKLPGGGLGTLNIADDGSMQVLPYTPAEKMKDVNLGGSVGTIGEYTGQMGPQYKTSMTPDAIATDARARERLAFEQNQGRKPQLYDGPTGPLWVTPPNAGPAPMGGPTQPVLDPSGKPVDPKKRDQPLTEAQGNATAYAMRAAHSEQMLRQIEAAGHNPAAFPGLLNRAAGGALNVIAPDAAQQYNAAKQNFVTAVLRKESGAAISQSEFDKEDQKYFPQPGDGPKVRADKQKARALAIESLKVQAGQAGRSALTQQAGGGWSIKPID